MDARLDNVQRIGAILKEIDRIRQELATASSSTRVDELNIVLLQLYRSLPL